MKYYNYDIVFQEIPDEVTLAVNITGCPCRCPGCHSKHLWGDIGTELSEDEIQRILSQYGNAITCFCIMGGDGREQEVERVAQYLHEISDVKVAWYSGRCEMPRRFDLFEYVKIGDYRASRGGLKSEETNQRLYRNCDGMPVDITSRFWRNKLEKTAADRRQLLYRHSTHRHD